MSVHSRLKNYPILKWPISLTRRAPVRKRPSCYRLMSLLRTLMVPWPAAPADMISGRRSRRTEFVDAFS